MSSCALWLQFAALTLVSALADEACTEPFVAFSVTATAVGSAAISTVMKAGTIAMLLLLGPVSAVDAMILTKFMLLPLLILQWPFGFGSFQHRDDNNTAWGRYSTGVSTFWRAPREHLRKLFDGADLTAAEASDSKRRLPPASRVAKLVELLQIVVGLQAVPSALGLKLWSFGTSFRDAPQRFADSLAGWTFAHVSLPQAGVVRACGCERSTPRAFILFFVSAWWSLRRG